MIDFNKIVEKTLGLYGEQTSAPSTSTPAAGTSPTTTSPAPNSPQSSGDYDKVTNLISSPSNSVKNIIDKIESLSKIQINIQSIQKAKYKTISEDGIQRRNRETFAKPEISPYYVFIDFLVFYFGGYQKEVNGGNIHNNLKSGTSNITDQDLGEFKSHLDTFTQKFDDPILDYTPYTQFMLSLADGLKQKRVAVLSDEQAGIYFLNNAIKNNLTLAKTIQLAVEYAEGISGFDTTAYILDPTKLQNDIRSVKIKIKNNNNQAALFEIHNLLSK